MQLRTFVALEIPAEHKRKLASQLSIYSRSYPRGINWVKPENLHLTLLFIGDTPRDVIPRIQESLSGVCSKLQPYSLSMLGCELFPAVNPRLLWVKLDPEDKSIFCLPKIMAKELAEHGIKPDLKPLKLHVTLARIKAPQSPAMEREFLQTDLASATSTYDTISYYRSSLQPDGPVYTALEQYRLT
jgi:2'-5' RNA ligase